MAPAQMPMVGRAFIEEILNRVFREGDLAHTQEALNKWDALGRESKLVLFGNANLVDDLDQTMLAFRRLAQEVNPSGSGYMVEINNMKRALTTALGGMIGGGAGGGMTGAGIGAAVGGTLGTIATNAALARLLFNPKYSKLLRQGIQLQLKGDKGGAAAVIGLLSKAANEAPPETDRPPLSLFVK
jgi:outer membrane lipoprotein SlyB